jgi:hypothetical protein
MHPLEWIGQYISDVRTIVCLASVNRYFYNHWRRWRHDISFRKWIDQSPQYNLLERYNIQCLDRQTMPKIDVILWIVMEWMRFFRESGQRTCLFLYGSNLHKRQWWHSRILHSNSLQYVHICSDTPHLLKVKYMFNDQMTIDSISFYPNECQKLIALVIQSHIWNIQWSFHNIPRLPPIHQTAKWTWTPLFVRFHERRPWYKRLPHISDAKKRPKLTLQNTAFSINRLTETGRTWKFTI